MARGRVRKRYYLEKSPDAGLTYRIVAESDNLEELKELGDLIDLEPVRWVVKDRWTRSIVDMSSQHLSILSSITGKPHSRESFESFVVPQEQVESYETVKKGRLEKLQYLARRFNEESK